MSREVIIDGVTVRLPGGWNGDRVHLARQIAEQLQKQVKHLSSTKELTLSVSGSFGGAASRVAERFAAELQANGEAARIDGGPRK